MSEPTPEKTHTHCQERSPVTGLPCTRRAEHQGEEYGRLCMSGDGNCWTNDPWRGQTEITHTEPCTCKVSPTSLGCKAPPLLAALDRAARETRHRDALADTGDAYHSFHGWVLNCLWCEFEAVGKTKTEALRGMQRHYDAVLPEGAQIHA